MRFSCLMEVDEEATHDTLRGHRQIIDRLIKQHDGRVFGNAGDSVIAEPPSAAVAVRCSIAIQMELAASNAEL